MLVNKPIKQTELYLYSNCIVHGFINQHHWSGLTNRHPPQVLKSLTWTGGLKGSIPGWSAIGSWFGKAWKLKVGGNGPEMGELSQQGERQCEKSWNIELPICLKAFWTQGVPAIAQSDNSNLYNHIYIIITSLKYTSGSTCSATYDFSIQTARIVHQKLSCHIITYLPTNNEGAIHHEKSHSSPKFYHHEKSHSNPIKKSPWKIQ